MDVVSSMLEEKGKRLINLDSPKHVNQRQSFKYFDIVLKKIWSLVHLPLMLNSSDCTQGNVSISKMLYK